ncbi:DegV family protein [Fictibacillus sp. FJAT-27399]|uniref:DegV family protein n=1 Tax=Fictibacillus sp. FJAT-27399 TaxID=1729689 RepID=UPI000785C810|nr:DegV family protein [Fictibacillus sp. FJAT-27399]
MNITFILDSASDYCVDHHTLSVPFVIVPLNITFKDGHFLDGVDISMDEFYERMAREENLPKTSQPSPQAFYNAFHSELEKGNELIYLGLSSNLSGTVQSAGIAKGMLDEAVQHKVHIIDTGTASAGIHVLLKEAEKLVQQGKSAEEIVASINEKKETVLAYVLLETLENVKKGGRISAVQGAIADFLNIKPLLSVQDGIVETVGKYRGKKKGLMKLKELLQEWKQKHPEKELFIIHSLPSKEEVIKEFGELFTFSAFKSISFTRFGSTIGTYASQNAIGFIFH